jgi:hypothetical protein
MAAKAGARIIVDSKKVGTAPREGEILEVIESPFGVRYVTRAGALVTKASWCGRHTGSHPSSDRTFPWKARPA